MRRVLASFHYTLYDIRMLPRFIEQYGRSSLNDGVLLAGLLLGLQHLTDRSAPKHLSS